jgi:capsular polysaccharide transport system ATP-binding protein
MLSIRNLTKSYRTKTGRHYVFKGVSADFPENANIGILGPNGAGKTTLLRILGGIDHPDSGTIHCDKTISWPLGLRGGFVGNLSGRENCLMICNLYGLDPQIIRQKLAFIKELSGIEEYFEEPVKYYSSGMGSRIGFALSMAFDFEIILIDELISVGDRGFRKIAKQALDEKRGRSNILMVSHSMGSIREFCEVGLVLRDGQMTAYDDINEAIGNYLQNSDKSKVRQQVDVSELTLDSDIFKESDEHELVELRKQINNCLGHIEEALVNGSRIKDPGTFFHCLGTCYSRLGHYTLALKYYRQAVEEKPQNSGFHFKLINTALELALHNEAEIALKDPMNWWPNNPNFLDLQGMLRAKQGHWQAATVIYQKAVQFSPNNARLHDGLARALLVQGNTDTAFNHSMKSIQIDNTNPGHFRTLSRVLAASKRYEESMRALREANEKTKIQKQSDQKNEIGLLQSLQLQLDKATDFIL